MLDLGTCCLMEARAGGTCKKWVLYAQMCSQPLLPALWVPAQLQQWMRDFPERTRVIPSGAAQEAGHTQAAMGCRLTTRWL